MRTDIPYIRIAEVCYTADQVAKTLRGVVPGPDWNDLTTSAKEDVSEQVRALNEFKGPTHNLSNTLQLWVAIVRLLLPQREHTQD